MKRKIIITFLIIMNFLLLRGVFSLYSTSVVNAATSSILGDVNNDGKVGSADYILKSF